MQEIVIIGGIVIGVLGLLPWGVAPFESGRLRKGWLRYGVDWGGSHQLHEAFPLLSQPLQS